ncbi:MAG: cell envelope integrity protein TolA [Sulfuricurvum sp.]|nr:cell envelope integrity protein TolA [Sulfuricurvum sp.]MDD5386647.1 cell envelope integrity protein TolA [Sulfuricurvum sp.]
MSFASLQSDVISISLDSSVVIDSKAQDQTSEEALPIQPLEIEKNIKVNEEKKAQPEITDLFSTIKATRSPKESKSNAKELSDLSALEEKVLSTKRSSQLFEKAKSLNLAKPGVKVLSASSGPMVNEYYAKVQGIIYSNFHPASGTEGFSARVRIVLTPDGKLESYRVVSSSGSAVFNAEVDWLKERLRQVALPQNPTGDEAVFEIILTAKD